MILKLSELRVVAFTKFAIESENTIVTLWILSTKTYFSQCNQVAITLSEPSYVKPAARGPHAAQSKVLCGPV